jgi:hypothetical protein
MTSYFMLERKGKDQGSDLPQFNMQGKPGGTGMHPMKY